MARAVVLASCHNVAFSTFFKTSRMTSRTDLLAWLNELLQINYTKVEQCGSGGAYCQIIDSIYGTMFSAVSVWGAK